MQQICWRAINQIHTKLPIGAGIGQSKTLSQQVRLLMQQ
jgi:hypothetical protein